MQNKELEKELDKPVTRNFEKRRVYSSFKDNIWGTDSFKRQKRYYNY